MNIELEHFGEAFLDLACHDSIALAFVSQLIAAEAQDFVGSMTSTFTSLIQRYRGNTGKPEAFKFLWNELPEEGVTIERGKHPLSHTVRLTRDGIMITERSGPYSWNRYNPRLNPAWMREWPESFLGSVLREDQIPEDDTSEHTMHKDTTHTDMRHDPLTRPQRRPGVVERYQGELLVLDMGGEQGAALNYSGQAIWELCDGRRRVNDIIHELSQRYARAESDMAKDVAQTLRQLQEFGVLEDGEDEKDEEDEEDDQDQNAPNLTDATLVSVAADPPAPGRTETATISPLYVTFGAHQVACVTPIPEVRQGIQAQFRSLLAAEAGHIIGHIQVNKTDTGYELVGDGVTNRQALSYAGVLEHLRQTVVNQFIHAQSDMVWLQASALACDRRAALFVGPWDEEKRALAARLGERGWSYLASEVVPFDPFTQQLIPFPLIPYPIEEHAGQAWQPEKVAREAYPVSAIFLPDDSPHASDTLSACAPAAAVVTLLQHCVSRAAAEERTLRCLSDLVQRVPLFQLSVRHPQCAVERVCEVHGQQQAGSVGQHQKKRDKRNQRAERKRSRTEVTAAVSSRSQIRNVSVQIFLSGGHQCTVQLPADSPILHNLLATLAARGRGRKPIGARIRSWQGLESGILHGCHMNLR